jgi:hypothetical protein
MKFTVKDNFPEVQRQLEELEKSVRADALVRSVNDVLAKGQTRMAREISQEFNIGSRDVKGRMQILKANYRGGVFRIEGTLQVTNKRGRSLNLINFGAKQEKGGVTVKILRTGGRKLVRGAFIANQGRTVFQRVGKGRLPIKAVQTIDVPQMFNTKRINKVVLKLLEDEFPVIFERNAKFYTDRFNARKASL